MSHGKHRRARWKIREVGGGSDWRNERDEVVAAEAEAEAGGVDFAAGFPPQDPVTETFVKGSFVEDRMVRMADVHQVIRDQTQDAEDTIRKLRKRWPRWKVALTVLITAAFAGAAGWLAHP